jgi:hypothetical protein
MKLVCNQEKLHWERKCLQPIDISAQTWFFVGPFVEFYGGCQHDPPVQQQVCNITLEENKLGSKRPIGV